MTKAEFLDGTPFHYFREPKTKPYTFTRWPDWKNGDPVGSIIYFGMNEANVTKVSYSYFDCYTTVVNKVLRTRIYFKDLYI
jgi:hypothetical protein